MTTLQDARSAKGLLLGLGYAGSNEGLADICPVTVDAIVERLRGPELYWRGSSLRARAFATSALGDCLRRPTTMRANPEAADKIRRTLLAALDDPDWEVRAEAAHDLLTLRTDPEVHAKLERLVAADPYVSSPNAFAVDRTREGLGRFKVREAATRSLEPAKEFLFYVMRTPETRECRIQQASEPPIGEQFIGPDTRNVAQPSMCSHYDATRTDPSLCWAVYPPNACSQ